jgi:hypothetical protein
MTNSPCLKRLAFRRLLILRCVILAGVLPDLTANVAVIGPGADQLTIRRDTGGNYRILDIEPGANVRIAGLTFQGPAYRDQRGAGYARVVNGVADIDAYEVQSGDCNDTALRRGGVLQRSALLEGVALASATAPSPALSLSGGSIHHPRRHRGAVGPADRRLGQALRSTSGGGRRDRRVRADAPCSHQSGCGAAGPLRQRTGGRLTDYWFLGLRE